VKKFSQVAATAMPLKSKSSQKKIAESNNSLPRKGKREEAGFRVLHVGPGQLLRRALENCCKIHADIEVVGWCRRLEDLDGQLKRANVVVVELDLGAIVWEFTRQIGDAFHLVGVATHPDDSTVSEAMAAGMHSIISSEDDPEIHLPNAIRSVGGDYFSHGVFRSSGTNSRRPKAGSGAVLTPRETQAVDYLGQSMQLFDISEAMGVSAKTADNFLRAAMVKLGLKERASLRKWATERISSKVRG
jgi:DNA-binding NarL/FixJ family response regulator